MSEPTEESYEAVRTALAPFVEHPKRTRSRIDSLYYLQLIEALHKVLQERGYPFLQEGSVRSSLYFVELFKRIKQILEESTKEGLEILPVAVAAVIVQCEAVVVLLTGRDSEDESGQ